MKKQRYIHVSLLSLVLILLGTLSLGLLPGCSNSRIPVNETPEHFNSNPEGQGQKLEIEVLRGEAHNHPLMAIWVEDSSGRFIQTLYVAESIAKGVFRHGDSSEGFWKPGEIQRPAALPRWFHQRGIRNELGTYTPTQAMPVADAYSGPTPPISFILHTRLDQLASGPLKIFLEINQTWDWNTYWHNNRYPDDEEYKASCQPALVYSATIDSGSLTAIPVTGMEFTMELIGRSHHSGDDGKLYSDLETMTSALHIVDEVLVRVVP